MEVILNDQNIIKYLTFLEPALINYILPNDDFLKVQYYAAAPDWNDYILLKVFSKYLFTNLCKPVYSLRLALQP